ncbi:hypothetical protein MRX96_005561 [Rhipicephalus microplus]
MSLNRYATGPDGVRQKPRRNEIPWQIDASPLYMRRQDHLNDRMRALYVSEPPPPPAPVTFTSPTTRQQAPLASRNHQYYHPRGSSDYDNTPPEPPKRTSSASMSTSYDSASTSSSSLQYRNGGGGFGAGSSSRSNEGLYASPGAPALAPLAVEEYVTFLNRRHCSQCKKLLTTEGLLTNKTFLVFSMNLLLSYN